ECPLIIDETVLPPGEFRASALLPAPAALAAAFARAALALAGHLAAGAARLAQADGNRLLAARDALAGAARSQLAAFALVHRALHFLLRFPAVFRHAHLRAGLEPEYRRRRPERPLSVQRLRRALNQRRRRATRRSAGRLHRPLQHARERIHQRAIAPAFRRFVAQHVERVAARHRLAIRPLGRQRVEDVDDADDLRQQRNLRVFQTVGIARAIQAL